MYHLRHYSLKQRFFEIHCKDTTSNTPLSSPFVLFNTKRPIFTFINISSSLSAPSILYYLSSIPYHYLPDFLHHKHLTHNPLPKQMATFLICRHLLPNFTQFFIFFIISFGTTSLLTITSTVLERKYASET